MHNDLRMKKLSLLFVVALLSHGLNAAELKGVTYDDSMKVGEKTLNLNGLGMRLATIFNVKVYVAALYVPEKANSFEKIASQKGEKVLIMHFMRDVGREKLSEAIIDGFQKACVEDECKMFEEQAKQFSELQPEVKDGQRLRYDFSAEGVSATLDDKMLGKVVGAGLDAIMLRVWVGDNPPNKELKQGLLGLES